MKKSDLKKYAQLIVVKGANVQKGQDVVINISTENALFASYIVEAAYKSGARMVTVEWTNDKIAALAYRNESVKTLSEVPEWKKAKLQYRVNTLPAMIHITDEDPDGMNKVNQDKLMKVRSVVGPIVKPYREQMDNKYQWTIAAAPSVAWAKKIFPKETKKNAVEKLWKAIFKTTRVEGDALKNWDLHNENIANHFNKLNQMNIDTLEYKSENGTNFKVSLLPNTKFQGGGERTLSGVFFNPNMPTEETFISPDPTSACGTVIATKPLSVMGHLISDFGFRFENGDVVEVLAKDPEAKKILENLISLDEGAKRLGEVALVPFNSPINETGILFYNTLFDENACCHLALGVGFNDTIVGYEKMTPEEIKKVGINDSMIHVDFMIGSKDLSIVAKTKDGKEIQIFKDGNWAI